VAILSGSDLASASLNLPAGSGVYTIEVAGVTPNVPGQVIVSVGASTQPGPVQLPEVPPPAATEEVGPVFADDVCNVGAQGESSTNVRGGPSTNFAILTSLDPGERLEVTGVYNTWYRVDIEGIGEGWVRRDVVTSFGPCDVIAVLDESQIPQAPQQIAPPAETEEVGAQTGPTATSTPSPTPPQEQQQDATATHTPTTSSAQIAPDDASYSLTIPLDSNASVLDFVSYPDGDREDRVGYDVSGMNPNVALSGGRARLILAVSCFGSGTNQVQFSSGGQTYACGDVIVDREVTADSRTGSVTITAVGGSNTYVQWVLTGTATRTN
jgi:uncharacterized protein YraI